MSLLDSFRAGNRRALSKIISLVENRGPGYNRLLSELFPLTGKAYKLGLTGPPGAGKSTLVDCLADILVKDGFRVGIIAVDPTSPFTGGAFLGDRIRMQSRSDDQAVFIRSMATRGSTGGLSLATRDVSTIYDAFGFDYILIETVGVGQVELDIVDAADTIIVTIVPESGDVIQAMKAGLMEIASVFCVNKADREGSERIVAELNHLLHIRRQKSDWSFPVVATTASQKKGIDLLVKAVSQHREYLEQTGRLKANRKEQLKKEVLEIIRHRLIENIEATLQKADMFDSLLEEIYSRKSDPVSAALAIYNQHYSHS